MRTQSPAIAPFFRSQVQARLLAALLLSADGEIGVTELQRGFKSVLDEVVRERTPYILLRGSRPEAALISYEDFVRFQRLLERDQRVVEDFDRWMARQAELSKDWSESEVEADIEAAIAEVRAERRARREAEAR